MGGELVLFGCLVSSLSPRGACQGSFGSLSLDGSEPMDIDADVGNEEWKRTVNAAMLPHNLSEVMIPAEEGKEEGDPDDFANDKVSSTGTSNLPPSIISDLSVGELPVASHPKTVTQNIDPLFNIKDRNGSVKNAIPSPPSANAKGARLFRAQVTNFLNNHMVYELIPDSGKVVILDSELVVKQAFHALHENGISCAPVWDSKRRNFVGMLTVTDFIDILRNFYDEWEAQGDARGKLTVSISEMLDGHKISYWSSLKSKQGTSVPRLITIAPEASLLEAIRLLNYFRVHRLCVVRRKGAHDTVLCILTHHSILQFLRENIPNHSIHLDLTIRELGIGTYSQIQQVGYDMPIIQVLSILSNFKISGVVIVDDKGKALNVYTRSDVKYLAMGDKSLNNLAMTVREAIEMQGEPRCVPTCNRDDTMAVVFDRLISTRKHRLVCLHPDGTVDGLISLSDILNFFTTRHIQAEPS